MLCNPLLEFRRRSCIETMPIWRCLLRSKITAPKTGVDAVGELNDLLDTWTVVSWKEEAVATDETVDNLGHRRTPQVEGPAFGISYSAPYGHVAA